MRHFMLNVFCAVLNTALFSTTLCDHTKTLCEQFPLLAGAALVLVGGALARALHAQRHAGALLGRHPGPGGVEGHHHILLVAVGGLSESADQ